MTTDINDVSEAGALRERLAGRVLAPGEDDYDDARAV